MRIVVLCLLWITLLPAGAALYRFTDDGGYPSYSDRPPNASAHSIKEPASAAPRLPAKPLTRPSPTQALDPLPYYSHLQLDGIGDQQTLRANNGQLSVQARLQPPLQPSHRLRLLLDGKPHGNPGRGPQLHLLNLDRGQHRLVLQVLDGERVLQQGPQITFVVLRAHR